jgi:hypothetical protein
MIDWTGSWQVVEHNIPRTTKKHHEIDLQFFTQNPKPSRIGRRGMVHRTGCLQVMEYKSPTRQERQQTLSHALTTVNLSVS